MTLHRQDLVETPFSIATASRSALESAKSRTMARSSLRMVFWPDSIVRLKWVCISVERGLQRMGPRFEGGERLLLLLDLLLQGAGLGALRLEQRLHLLKPAR